MAKRSFWETLKELFRDEEEEIITDEQWAEMQAEERKKREELLLDDEPLEVDNSWKCPVCHRKSPEDAVFCIHCGYHPGSFRDIIDDMTDEQIRMILNGSNRYPAQEVRFLENELVRRAGGTVEEEPVGEGWKCAICGQEGNPEEEFFCQKCGEYRY
jgi:hypothetical protein